MSDRIPRAEDFIRDGPKPRTKDARRSRVGGGVEMGLASDAIWSAIRSPLRLQILEAVATKPGATARDLAAALGSSAPRLHYHLNILVQTGLLRPLAGGVSGAGYEVVEVPRFRSRCEADGSASVRLGRLIVEVVTAGIRAAKPSRGRADGASFARAGHEALAPHEIRLVEAHLRGIDAILERAKDRRRRSRSLVRASVFLSLCFTAVDSPTLPDSVLGWGELSADEDGDLPRRRNRAK